MMLKNKLLFALKNLFTQFLVYKGLLNKIA